MSLTLDDLIEAVTPDDEEPATFRAMLRLCGLSGAEAEKVLRQPASTIRKKSAGLVPFKPTDLEILRDVWRRILDDTLTVDDPLGVWEAAKAIRLLEGVDG